MDSSSIAYTRTVSERQFEYSSSQVPWSEEEEAIQDLERSLIEEESLLSSNSEKKAYKKFVNERIEEIRSQVLTAKNSGKTVSMESLKTSLRATADRFL